MTRNLYSKFILAAICSLLLTFCFAIAATAQNNNDCYQPPVHFGLTYPLSTNGLQAPHIGNAFSLHGLIGVSASEKAVTISGIANIIKQDAAGLTLAGIANTIGGATNGLQIAGIANLTGHANGAQLGGIANVSSSLNGVQMAGIANITKHADGLQMAGMVNTAQSVNVQLSGFANAAKEADVQVAGFVNTGKNISATQISGFVNTAQQAEHQIAGFINIAQKVAGMQIAGFINVADECDYPIGLINIVKNGEMQLGASIDEMGSALVNFRSGGRVLYGILGVGYNYQFAQARYVLEAGLGAHFPLHHNFRLNMEMVSTSLSDIMHNVYFKSSGRLLAELKLANTIGIFAGPSINYLGYQKGQTDLRNNYLWQERNHYHYNGIYIGGVAGIHFNL